METQEIKQYLHDWWNKEHNTTDEFNESGCLEILIEAGRNEIEVDRDSHRWWDEVTKIAQFGDKYFRYTWATANRDESVQDLGWDFSWSSVSEVEPYMETVVVTKWRNV